MVSSEIPNQIATLIARGYGIIHIEDKDGAARYKVLLSNIGLMVGLEFNSSGMVSMWFMGKDKGYDGIMTRTCDLVLDAMGIKLLDRAIYREDKESGERVSIPIVETYSPDRFEFMDTLSLYTGELIQPAYPKQIRAIYKSGLYTVTELQTTDKTKNYEIFVKSTGLCVMAKVYNGNTVELSFESKHVDYDRVMTRVCDSMHDLIRGDGDRLILRHSENKMYYDRIPNGKTGDPERYNSIYQVFWDSCPSVESSGPDDVVRYPSVEPLADSEHHEVEYLDDCGDYLLYSIRDRKTGTDIGVRLYDNGKVHSIFRETDTFFGLVPYKICNEIMDLMRVPSEDRSVYKFTGSTRPTLANTSNGGLIRSADQMHDPTEWGVKPGIENLVNSPFYNVELVEEEEGYKVYNVRRFGLDVDVGINLRNTGFTEMLYKKTDTFFGHIAVKFCDEVMDVMNVPDSIRSVVEIGESGAIVNVVR